MDEQLPADAKELVLERFKDVSRLHCLCAPADSAQIVNEIQADPRYEQAIGTLLDLVKKYGSLTAVSLRDAAAASVDNIEVAANDEAETAASLFRTIVESFTGDLKPLFSTLDKLIHDVQGDERVSTLLKKLDRFVGRAIHDPGFAVSTRAQRRAETLFDEAQDLVNSNAMWKDDASALVREATRAFETAAHDKALQNLGEKLQVLGEATTRFGLGGVEAGKRGLGLTGGLGDVFADVSQVVLPRLIKAVKSIPLPRIEVSRLLSVRAALTDSVHVGRVRHCHRQRRV